MCSALRLPSLDSARLEACALRGLECFVVSSRLIVFPLALWLAPPCCPKPYAALREEGGGERLIKDLKRKANSLSRDIS